MRICIVLLTYMLLVVFTIYLFIGIQYYINKKINTDALYQ